MYKHNRHWLVLSITLVNDKHDSGNTALVTPVDNLNEQLVLVKANQYKRFDFD